MPKRRMPEMNVPSSKIKVGKIMEAARKRKKSGKVGMPAAMKYGYKKGKKC